MKKSPRVAYTLEFKLGALRRVRNYPSRKLVAIDIVDALHGFCKYLFGHRAP